MSWETATDKLIEAFNELHFSDIKEVGIPPDYPNLQGGTPITYISESRARFDYGNQNVLERAITSVALNNLVIVLHQNDQRDADLHTLRQYYSDVVKQVRAKVEEKEFNRAFASDGDVGFSAGVIDVQPNFDPTRPIAWVWFVIEVRAFH
jgi:hypothetical protein